MRLGLVATFLYNTLNASRPHLVTIPILICFVIRFGSYKSFLRLNIQLWRVVSNSLPVKSNLAHRGIQLDKTCNLCGEGKENTKHILRDSLIISRLWFISPLDLRVDAFSRKNFTDWLFIDVGLRGAEAINFAMLLYWAIWSARNQFIFYSISFDSWATVRLACNLKHDFAVALTVTRQ